MQKITPFLWFDGKAEEAMEFYTSVFENSRVISVMRYGDAEPGPKGAVMSATFELLGQQFIALNGGPHFHVLAGHIVFRELQDASGGG
jgi:predicted 3-demethylubiquinone-9 3-methyltransferase (glyoxalase superfamily)